MVAIPTLIDHVTTFLLNKGSMSDVSLIRVESERAAQEMHPYVIRAKAHAVYDERSCALAEQYVKEIKAYGTALKLKLDQWCEAPKASIKLAKEDVQPRLDVVAECEALLKEKCTTYRAGLALMRAEAMQKAQALLTANAPAQQTQEAIAVVVGLQAPKTQGVHYVKRVVWEVEDANKIPDQFWKRTLSEAAVDYEIAKGTRVIPGIKISEIEVMAASTGKVK